MMAEIYSFLTLILCLLNGGGNDLLDYLPTEPYWAEKKVAISVEAMETELKQRPESDIAPWVAALGSPDAAARDAAADKIRKAGSATVLRALQTAATESTDSEIRRRARLLIRQVGGDEIERSIRTLMAIRTLGEIGDAKALPALKTELASKVLFVADYAQVAIDRIEGRAAGSARAFAPAVSEDVWLLPKECKTIGQLVPRRGSPLGFAEFMAAVKADDPAVKDESAAEVTRTILSLAEKIGNVRVDAATFGIAGMPVGYNQADASGYVALICRGRYNADWIRTWSKSGSSAERVLTRDVEGSEIFSPSGEQAWIMPSDDVFVFLAAPSADALPVREMAHALKEGKGTLAGDEETKKRFASIDTKQVLWAASALTPEQKSLPAVGAFDALALVGTRQGRTLKLTITGTGDDAVQVKAAADQINKHVKDSAEFLSGMQVASVIRMAVELLRSAHVEIDDKIATLSAKLETTPAAILSLPMLRDD